MSGTMNRRAFLGTVATGVAAAELVTIGRSGLGSGSAASAAGVAVQRGTHTSFSSMKQIDAGLLNVGYAEAGPVGGPPVLCLHGWPYDIHSFVDVAPALGSAGYRVIVPYLRGYGSTRFLSPDTFRNGEPAAVAHDIIASAVRRPSGIRTTSPSRSTTIAGASGWPTARRGTATSRGGLPPVRSSACPRSPSRAMPTVPHTPRTPVPIA